MIPYPAVRRKAGGARDFLLGFLELGGQFLPVCLSVSLGMAASFYP